MGSLMAGWDSPVLGDDKKVHARRNRSLTKDEVEAFWKQRRRSEDGGEQLITSPLASPATVRARVFQLPAACVSFFPVSLCNPWLSSRLITAS
jgi:hypothetical protein